LRVGQTGVTLETLLWTFQQGSTPEDIVDQFPSLTLADVPISRSGEPSLLCRVLRSPQSARDQEPGVVKTRASDRPVSAALREKTCPSKSRESCSNRSMPDNWLTTVTARNPWARKLSNFERQSAGSSPSVRNGSTAIGTPADPLSPCVPH